MRVFHLYRSRKGVPSDRASISENLYSKITKGRAGKELGVRAGATLTTGREGKSVLATRVWGQEVGSPLHSS